MNVILKNFYESNYSNHLYCNNINESIFKKNGKNIFIINSDVIKKNKNENDLKNKRYLRRLREKTLKQNRKIVEEISKHIKKNEDDESENSEDKSSDKNSIEENNNNNEKLFNEFYIYNLPLKYNKNMHEMSSNVGIILKTLLNNEEEEENKFKSNKYDSQKNINNTENIINPLKIIQSNLSNEPENNDLYYSKNLQIKCLGNDKNRKNMINGVNRYITNKEKYKKIYVDIPSERKKKEKVNIDKIMKKNKILNEKELLKFRFNLNDNKHNQKRKKFFSQENNLNNKDFNLYASLDERLITNEKSAYETLQLFKLRSKEYNEIKNRLIQRVKQ